MIRIPDKSIVTDYSDTTWTNLTLGFAGGLTFLSVGLELASKISSSSDGLEPWHGLGYSNIYLYFGAELEDLSEEPWAITSSLILSAALAVAMAIYRTLKLR